MNKAKRKHKLVYGVDWTLWGWRYTNDGTIEPSSICDGEEGKPQTPFARGSIWRGRWVRIKVTMAEAKP
jgi:hypothetical protein